MRPVRRPGFKLPVSPSSVKCLAEVFAHSTPLAYVKVRSEAVDLLDTVLALGGHTTRVTRRAARLAATSSEASVAGEVLARLVPHCDTPRLLAKVWAAALHSHNTRFVQAVREHPADDATLLGLLDALPSNIGVLVLLEISPKRDLLKSVYGHDLRIVASAVSAALLARRDAPFAALRAELDAMAAADPSGSWVKLVTDELCSRFPEVFPRLYANRQQPAPDTFTATAVDAVLATVKQLGPRAELALSLRDAGAPASLDELVVLVESAPTQR